MDELKDHPQTNLMDIFAGISAASAAIDIAKGLRSVEKSYDTVELKMQVVDLIDKLVDVKGALQDAREALDAKEAQIVALQKAASVRSTTLMHNSFRYQESEVEPGKPQGTPYCQRCDEQDGRLVRTIDNPKERGVSCPQCKTAYNRGATQFLWDTQR